MTYQQVDGWFAQLKNIWETKNPQEIEKLVSKDFLWYETPFTNPLKTKETLLKDWQGILKQDNISFQYEILYIKNNDALAHWSVMFTRIPSSKKVRLDGIFKVTLDNDEKCTEFRQWYNSK